MSSIFYSFVLSLHVSRTYAYTKFETTCAVPSNSAVSFVTSPDVRGTLDILWSCVFTILACTWTIQHLNIPEQRKGELEKGSQHGFWCSFKWGLRNFWSNLKWMLATIFAPEYILGKAMGDFVVARRLKEQMKPMASADGREWSLTHGFFANMGGFTGVEHSEYGESGETLTPAPVSLTANDIYWLRVNKNIDRLPDITATEILDKSKSSVFVKAIAVVQVLWITIQVIVRSARGLYVSQLELVVTAFCVCAIITYSFLVWKPQGVQVSARPIQCKPGSIQKAIKSDKGWYLRVLFMPGTTRTAYSGTFRTRIPNDYADGKSRNSPVYLGGMILGGVVFGSIHVAGWNFEFPTPVEQKLWRISSLVIAFLLPLLFLPVLLIFSGLAPFLNRAPWSRIVLLWGLALGVIYVASRLYLLVEIFRTLVFLPPDAYVSTWTSHIPHIS